jgi:hypothetical protein
MKKIDEENIERRVAFEVSVSKLELMENQPENSCEEMQYEESPS